MYTLYMCMNMDMNTLAHLPQAVRRQHDARAAAGHGLMPCGVAGGFFAWGNILLEFLDDSKGALSGSNVHRSLTRCLYSLPARAARALRPAAERADAADYVADRRQLFRRARGAAFAAFAAVARRLRCDWS